jgi:hypothetical protein
MVQIEEVHESIRGDLNALDEPYTIVLLSYPQNYHELMELATYCQGIIDVADNNKDDLAKAEQADQTESDLLIQDREQDYRSGQGF